MSAPNLVVPVVSVAAALVMLSGGAPVAAGITVVTCTPKPTKPDHPAAKGAPKCCPEPKVWQERYSGGLFGQPKKYFWVCQMPPTPPK
jgi:hypothetical protein